MAGDTHDTAGLQVLDSAEGVVGSRLCGVPPKFHALAPSSSSRSLADASKNGWARPERATAQHQRGLRAGCAGLSSRGLGSASCTLSIKERRRSQRAVCRRLPQLRTCPLHCCCHVLPCGTLPSSGSTLPASLPGTASSLLVPVPGHLRSSESVRTWEVDAKPEPPAASVEPSWRQALHSRGTRLDRQ